MSTTPVGKALEKVIWEVHQCEKILEHGAPSEDRLLDKLDHLVGVLPSLREAAKESEAADDDKGSATVFPVDILRHVDEEEPRALHGGRHLGRGGGQRRDQGQVERLQEVQRGAGARERRAAESGGSRRGDGEGGARAGDPDPE